MSLGPSLAVGADNAAYLIANDQSSIAWMGRLFDNSWSGWFNTAAGSSANPMIGSSGQIMFAAVVDGTGAVWTCSMGVGNRYCGPWTNRQANFGAAQSVSATVQGGDLYLAARDSSGSGWWYQLSTNSWTTIGSAVTPGSPLVAAASTPSESNIIGISGNICGDQPLYFNGISEYDTNFGKYVFGLSQTSVDGDTALAWNLGVRSSMTRNGTSISPVYSVGYKGTASDPDTGSPILGVEVDSLYPLTAAAHYKQTAVHSWDGSAVNCTVIGNPITSTYERDLPLGTATPIITGISPSSGTVGQTLSLTVTGQNFSSINDWENNLIFQNGNTGDSTLGFTPKSLTDTQLTGTLTISGTAAVGDRSVYLTSPAGDSNSVTFTVQGDPTPVITSITPNNFDDGSLSVPVAIVGSGFGANPVIAVSGYGVSVRIDPSTPPADTQIAALFDIAKDADPSVDVSVFANGNATHNFAPQVGGGSQRQSNSKTVTTNANANRLITILYRAFIRGNWVQGPTNCTWPVNLPLVGSKNLWYRGDNRDFALNPQMNPNLPTSNPYRASVTAVINLDIQSPLLNYTGQGGTTRQYDGHLVLDNKLNSFIADINGFDRPDHTRFSFHR